MRASDFQRLAKLRTLRALRERLLLAERVLARGIADKALNQALALAQQVDAAAVDLRRQSDTDYADLERQKIIKVRRVTSVFDSATARTEEVRGLRSSLRGSEDAANAYVAEADRIALSHNQLRARVGGLDKLVSELQADERRRADVSQDEATETAILDTIGVSAGGDGVSDDSAESFGERSNP